MGLLHQNAIYCQLIPIYAFKKQYITYETHMFEKHKHYLPVNGKEVYMNEGDWRDTEGIPGLIYDSLPDRFGNNLLKAYFTDKGLTEREIDVFT